MPVPVYQVDAFTSDPFRGNPAAVCILDGPANDPWMQCVAAEMNLSETAFLHREATNHFSLRWMTPTVEVDLCGHATLAAAHTLYELGRVDRHRPIRFNTRSGLLTARLIEGFIELDFPAKPAQPATDVPDELVQAIAAQPVFIGKNDFDYLVELESEQVVRALEPNFHLLSMLGVRGIVVTAMAAGGENYDFVSRGFFPGSGINEDPVTGSAHCMLGPYWSPRLKKTEMTGYQASARGGYVALCLEGDRVYLRGRAVTILRGELAVEPTLNQIQG